MKKAESHDRKKLEELTAKQARGEKLSEKDREFVQFIGGFLNGRVKAVPKKHMVDAKILEAAITQRDTAEKKVQEQAAAVRKATADWNEAQKTIHEYKTVEADLLERVAAATRERDEARLTQRREIERLQETVANSEKIWAKQCANQQLQIREQSNTIEALKATQSAPQLIGDVIVYVLRNKATGAVEECSFKPDAFYLYQETENPIRAAERIAINIEETREFAREKITPVERLAVFGEAE